MVVKYARRAVAVPLESTEQERLFEWAKYCPISIDKNGVFCSLGAFGMEVIRPEGGFICSLSEFMFAIPNGQMLAGGAKQRARMMNALKKRGFKNGVSDIMLALPVGKYHGMFIELKRTENFKVSTEQQTFLDMMKSVRYFATVANGAEAAIQKIMEYTDGRA